MTKKLYESLKEAVYDETFFGWLYDHEDELSKDEIARIARELACASFDPFFDRYDKRETISRESIKNAFLRELREHYEIYGWDEE